ncbi:MAG: replication endonuclease [Pseudomonadota bacterium]
MQSLTPNLGSTASQILPPFSTFPLFDENGEAFHPHRWAYQRKPSTCLHPKPWQARKRIASRREIKARAESIPAYLITAATHYDKQFLKIASQCRPGGQPRPTSEKERKSLAKAHVETISRINNWRGPVKTGSSEHMLTLAEEIFCGPIPGKSQEAQLRRIASPTFWYRRLKILARQEFETDQFRLKAIGGRRKQKYVSKAVMNAHLQALDDTKAWMKATAVRFVTNDGEINDVSLETLAGDAPKRRLFKLMAFVSAMDSIAKDDGLAVAMMTVTLPGEWHINPGNGKGNWNGKTPNLGHKKLAGEWQDFRRDLAKHNVHLTGFRVAEPHQDETPHWHLWLMFRPEHTKLLHGYILKHWPGILKVVERDEADVHVKRYTYFDTREDAINEKGRKGGKKGKAQVELSMIDRRLGSGSSYAMKYIAKTVGVEVDATDGRRYSTAVAVAAWRSTWRIRAFQMFGLKGKLTAWDELRRVKELPVGELSGKLWAAATSNQARTFLESCGGTATAPTMEEEMRPTIRLVREPGRLNAYGEEGIGRVIGLDVQDEAIPTRRPNLGLVRLIADSEAEASDAEPEAASFLGGIVRLSYPRNPAADAFEVDKIAAAIAANQPPEPKYQRKRQTPSQKTEPSLPLSSEAVGSFPPIPSENPQSAVYRGEAAPPRLPHSRRLHRLPLRHSCAS